MQDPLLQSHQTLSSMPVDTDLKLPVIDLFRVAATLPPSSDADIPRSLRDQLTLALDHGHGLLRTHIQYYHHHRSKYSHVHAKIAELGQVHFDVIGRRRGVGAGRLRSLAVGGQYICKVRNRLRDRRKRNRIVVDCTALPFGVVCVGVETG